MASVRIAAAKLAGCLGGTSRAASPSFVTSRLLSIDVVTTGFSAGHRLEERDREAFPKRWKGHKIGGGEQFPDIRSEPQDPHDVLQAKVGHESGELCTQRAVAGQHHPERRQFRTEQRGGSNQVLEALLGCKPTSREDHEGVIPDAELRADLSRSP